MDDKINVYMDVDDVILLSTETVLDILNQRYNIDPPKTIKDVKQWNYKSIYRKITQKEINDIFDSDDFWDNVKVSQKFLDMVCQPWFIRDYNLIFFTKGTVTNLTKKKEFFESIDCALPPYQYIGIDPELNKNDFDLTNGIQVDDNIYNLNTNATWKILLKNSHEADYNDIKKYHGTFENEMVYSADTITEVAQILQFIPIMMNDDMLRVQENNKYKEEING